MKKDISKTTKTQKQGNGKRKQLRETKRNAAGLKTAKKRKAKRSEVEREVKEDASQQRAPLTAVDRYEDYLR